MSAVEQQSYTNIEFFGEYEQDPDLRLVDVDVLFPHLGPIKEGFTQDGLSLLEGNRHLYEAGKFDAVPLPIDVLGTANKLESAREEFGEESQQYLELLFAHKVDSKRLWAESKRKNRWEHYRKLFQPFDKDKMDYTFSGLSINQALVSGLSPSASESEQTVRVAEYVRQQVTRVIGASTLARKGVSMIAINECPDKVIEEYRTNPQAAHSNYAPAVEKFVIEEYTFHEGGRTYESLALPGLHITHDVIVETLAEIEALDIKAMPAKEELRTMQFINQGESALLRMAKLLDKNASITSGQSIFMGEVVPADHPKDYEMAIIEAEARQNAQEDKSAEVADFLIGLARKKEDSRLASAKLGSFLKGMLFEEVKQNPEAAANVFDIRTANGIIEINQLLSLGLFDEAGELEVKVFNNAPEAAFCGAGSCGLEAVNPLSKEAREAEKQGLKTGNMLKDKERCCPDCRHMTVIYDLKSGSKVCINPKCHKKEIKK